MTRILLTGASGYIGGQVLHSLVNHPATNHAKFTCLVRDVNKAQPICNAYPHVSLQQGDLDSLQLLSKLATESDIVLHLASTNHIASTTAIALGLRASTPARDGKPGTLIQMSGASLFTISELSSGSFGEPSTKTYDDVANIEEIIAIIKANPKREVDNFIISHPASDFKSALIIGPLFYGDGEGKIKQRSIQAPEIARATLQRQKGFVLGKGENSWSNLHIRDLGMFFAALVSAVIHDKDGALWNREGMYCIENGIATFGDLSKQIAQEARSQGLLESDECETVDAQMANDMSDHASALWGTNARIKSRRANELLSWQARGPTLKETITDVVREEARRLGM